MEEILYQYNPWWQEEYFLDNVINRPQYLSLLENNLENEYIVFFTGLRRVGKTTLMKLIIKRLIVKGINPANILYFSVDDYLLNNYSFFEILDNYKQINKLKVDEKIYVFFDEVTHQSDFYQQLKNLYDKYNMKIFATSSSSSLLRDKKAHLTGRSITIEVKPLDFEEYKIFKNINLMKKDNILNESYFKDYLQEGGLPENVLNPNREYLMNLVDDIIQKDIAAYHGLKNHQLLRDFFSLLMERSGKQFSINKIANILQISPDTARRYLRYFEDVYLIYLIPRWGKTNEKILSPKKIYSCDLGIKYLFNGNRDFGSYFENYIYLKLRNKKELFYVYENGLEIDFFTTDKVLLEVKYNSDLNEKQKYLFDHFSADKKIVIDSVQKLPLLDEL